jgi:acetoin utilization deacetylase AcuC-like enzyme
VALTDCCRYFTACLKAAAAKHCGGKLLFFHEGGYSAYYVPFCGLAVVEELAGITTKVVDPELEEHCKVREQWCGDGVGVRWW